MYNKIEFQNTMQKGKIHMYDCIIVGAGIAGATVARKLAEEKNKRVLVLERRNHIGGNCYDRPDDYGILIHE